MPLGQQSDYGYMDAYSKRKYGSNPEQDQYADQFSNLKSQAALTATPVEQVGTSTDTQPLISKDFAQGASRGMSGGLGSMLMSGGMASANPYAMAGGLGLMALEGDAQARQAEDQAKAQEAQMRKQQQLSAINSLMAVSRGLGV